MTIGLGVCTFLLVVNDDHASILHRYGDIKPQICVQPILKAKSLLRMADVTRLVGGGKKMTTYLEFPMSYRLFTI